MKVVHVITGLQAAGAELKLLDVVNALRGREIESVVVSLEADGPVGELLRSNGFHVHSLGLTLGSLRPFAILNFYRLLRSLKPSLVHTWLYHADLLGGFTSKILRIPVVWSIHHADPSDCSRTTGIVAKVGSAVSPWLPHKIIACSEAAKSSHERFGYATDKMIIIENGIDINKFSPRLNAYKKLTRELGITNGTLLVGNVARYHPIKDHQSLIAAFARVHSVFPQSRLILAGRNVDWANRELVEQIDVAGVREAVYLLGERRDIPELMSCLDLFVLSSRNESFSLVLAEAMACGTPCVSTDVGMASAMIGDTGKIVPRGDSNALAEAVMAFLTQPIQERESLGVEARQRIVNHFALDEMIDRYVAVYEECLGRPNAQLPSPSIAATQLGSL